MENGRNKKRKLQERDDLDSAWKDFESILSSSSGDAEDDQRLVCESISADTAEFCNYCDSFTMVTDSTRGDRICTSCGACRPDYYSHSDSADYVQARLRQYKRPTAKGPGTSASYAPVFHYHEHLRQLGCTDPPIPPGYWLVIRESWDRLIDAGVIVRDPVTGDITKEDVYQLLLYASTSYQPTRHAPFPHNILKWYMERWISIRYILVGFRPPVFTKRFLMELEWRFLKVDQYWESVRHSEECKKKGNRPLFILTPEDKKCPREFRCRHNLPNFGWMLRQFIMDILYKNPNDRSFDQYKILLTFPYIPNMKTEARIRNLELYWELLEPFTGIPLYTLKKLV